MKSFPSTLNESEAMYSNGKAASYSSIFDVERIKALNLNTSLPVIKEQLKQNNINAGNFQRYPAMTTLYHSQSLGRGGDAYNNEDTNKYSDYVQNKLIFYENPLMLPANAIALAKDYEWIYKYKVNSVVGSEKSGDSINMLITSTDIVPSMFNPMFGVSAMGLIRNTPLLNDFEHNQNQYDTNIDDCSIRTLCALSKSPNSPIGMHRYKYADFMYCRDLGKVSNNHLITLRKFAHPVPDHIGKGTTPNYLNGAAWSWEAEGDVGRLIAWFGTDDNKIEDIAKFSYHATWKEYNAEIEQQESKADDPNTGIIGMLSNSLSPAYNKAVNAGSAGNHSILTWLGSQASRRSTQGIGSNNALLYNYDNYKIYTPKNTIQSNHQYEGKLEFSHEFQLVFSYELRAYDNINPRSAFLDLLGNILEVTYRRGKFWGGSRKIIGPAQDSSMFNKVYSFVDKTFDQIPGFAASFASGKMSLSKIMGTLSSAASSIATEVWNKGSKLSQSVINGTVKADILDFIKNLNANTAWTDALRGMVKNALGRPQFYAWHSLVSGDDVGLWHVTVGNPKNPILSIGNLILTNAEIVHSGPLGVDDFPTHLKVIVTLKHPRPRDITDIGRMYTGGTNALYHVLSGHPIEDFYSSTTGTSTNNENANTIAGKKSEENSTSGKKENISSATPKASTDPSTDQESDKPQPILTTKGQEDTKRNVGIGAFVPTTNNGLPDPSISESIEVDMMRKNTWSDTVFTVMMQEVA